MYGPTVVTTTYARVATSRSEASSVTSAMRISGPPPRRACSCSSFSRLRPATAHVRPSGACSWRYWAVSAPVNPVAPKTTMSSGRSDGAMRPSAYSLRDDRPHRRVHFLDMSTDPAGTQRGFFRDLFDFSFTRLITPRVVRVLYAI